MFCTLSLARSRISHLEGQGDLVNRLLVTITRVTIWVLGAINLLTKPPRPSKYNFGHCSSFGSSYKLGALREPRNIWRLRRDYAGLYPGLNLDYEENLNPKYM